MDGFTLSFLEKELHEILLGGRVDKVNQPERDTLVLTVRNQNATHKLALSANANQARIQLTRQSYENPPEPPMFCMLARKHLLGSRIAEICQIGGDRVMALRFEGTSELGDMGHKTLYLEMMGRHSNLILVDESGMIMDSVKHVNRDMSRIRVVLPGQPYSLPPGKDKLAPGAMTQDIVMARFASLAMPLYKALMENVAGMAGICAREVCAQLGLEPEAECQELNWDVLGLALTQFFQTLAQRFSPVTMQDEFGVVLDFFPFPYLTHSREHQEPKASLSAAMDAFYLGRDLRQRMQQRGIGLQRHIKNAIERMEKKQGILLDVLHQPEKTEQYRVFGELLTANLHRINKGQDSVTLPNYYADDMAEVAIPLSTQHTPAQNAQQYYTKYRKAKVAAEYAAEQLEKTRQDLEFLENTLEDLDKCESSADLAEVRFVLVENGYLRPDSAERKKKKIQQGKPYRFLSEDGTEILVGKNSIQNDRLTLHARGNELWLHAQGIPGSHVIVRTEAEPTEATLEKAAKLAAYFSKGRNHPALPVDFTKRKYVKKTAGAPAGFVTYTHFQTAIIGLTQQDVASLSKECAGKTE